MQASHLQSIVALHIASLVMRVAVMAAAVALAIATTALGQLELGPSIETASPSAACSEILR